MVKLFDGDVINSRDSLASLLIQWASNCKPSQKSQEIVGSHTERRGGRRDATNGSPPGWGDKTSGGVLLYK